MDHQALKDLIEREGIKKRRLAERTGLTPQGFYNKLNGDTEFNRKELEALKDALHLSTSEFMSLFFSSQGIQNANQKGVKDAEQQEKPLSRNQQAI